MIRISKRFLGDSGGHWFILAAATLWGTTGTAQALAPSGATPLVVGTLRLIVGGLGLACIAYWRGVFFVGKKWRLLPLIIGVVAVAAYQVCFFAGVDRTGVAVGTIVGIGSSPVMAGLLAVPILGERLSRQWMIATGLAVCGCTLLVLSGGDVGVDALGVILSLGAGFAYAVYTIASKFLLEDHPPVLVMTVLFCAGALILSPLMLTADLAWIITPNGLLVTLYLGFGATSLSYLLFATGLLTVPAATAVTLTLAEPLTAGLLGVLLLGEALSVTALIGIGLLFAGLFVLTRRRKVTPSLAVE